MAIRFLCRECGQLLSIGRRKAGTVIECPKCAAVQVVPGEDTARAGGGQAVSLPSQDGSVAEVATEKEEPGEWATSAAPPIVPERTFGPPPPSPSDVSRSPPDEWILFRRSTIYVQGVLFVLVALVSLGLGVAIGRVSTYVAPVRGQTAASGDEPGQVLVDGRLSYDPGDGRPAGDQHAVALFLPENPKPAVLIPISGLRPQDSPPVASNQGLRGLEALGGVYARAGASGGFHAVLPHGGKYYLLLISRHANRPEDDYIDEVDRGQIGEYFNRAADLIGRSKYRWTLETFRSGGPPVVYSFGADGQEE